MNTLAILSLCFSFAAAAGRPWILNQISSQMVPALVSFRSSTIQPEQASAIAERMVSGAIAPPQVTDLVNSMESIVIADGENPPPSDLLKMAQQAKQAYTDVKASQGFSNYLRYVSINAKHFNLNAMYNQGTPQMNARVTEALTRLEQTAQGREAVQTMEDLIKQISHDAGLPAPPIPHV